jgi:hypothetical protein
MSLESHEAIAVVAPPALTRPAPILDTPSGMEALPGRTPEEIRAVEAVFAQQDKESATVVNLLGVYSGGMILRDILADTFSKPADEVEDEPDEASGEV